MPKILKAQIRKFLHDYSKEVFKVEHEQDHVDKRHEAAERLVKEILDQKFHYHLHQKVDPDRAETIQLIHNYCTEALLPPVLQRMAADVLLAQEKHTVAMDLIRRVLDTLAEDDVAAAQE